MITAGSLSGTISDLILPLGLNAELQYDATTVRLAILAGIVAGDFNHDGAFDCTDIDALVATIASGSNDAAFDLTGDGLVTVFDRDEWLAIAGAENLASGNSYLLGDANLDGEVDGVDFLTWNTNKFTQVAAWCSADFTADGTVDGTDFLAWNTNKFSSADSLMSVPEPATTAWLVCLFAGLAAHGRRRFQLATAFKG